MLKLFRKNWTRGEAAGTLPLQPSITADVRAKEMGRDGIVFLHTGTGELFTSNHIGARIWKELAEKASLQSIAAGISTELGVPRQQAEEDTAEFVAALEKRGLVSRERASA
jgi:hypothetical protein